MMQKFYFEFRCHTVCAAETELSVFPQHRQGASGSHLLTELSTTVSFLISFDQTLMSLLSLSVETVPSGINNMGDGGGDK